MQFVSKQRQRKADTFASRLVMDIQLGDEVDDVQQIARLEEQLSQLLGADVEGFLTVSYQYIKKLCDTLPMNSHKLLDFCTRLLKDKLCEEGVFLDWLKPDRLEVRHKVNYILSQYPRAFNFIDLLATNTDQTLS